MKILSLILLTLISLSAFSQKSEKFLDAGYEKYSEEDYKGAIRDFNKAQTHDSTNSEIYYLRGVCFSLMGETTAAMKDLEKATQLNPKYAEAYYEIGYLYLTNKNAEEAIKAFDQTIAASPDFAEAWVSRGTAKCMIEDREGAKADWDKAKALGVGYSEYMICD